MLRLPTPPPHKFSNGPSLKEMDTSFRRNDFCDPWFETKRYLWLLEYRRPFLTTACPQKKSQKVLVPFLPRVSDKRIGSASKMNYFGLRLGKVFRKLAALILPPFSRSHHPGRSQRSLRKLYPQASFVSNILLIDTFCAWAFFFSNLLFT